MARPRESGNPRVSAFEKVADALYALAPRDFIAARDAAADRARRAGDRVLAAKIHALRRPTAAAHALNLLVRAHPGYVDQLRELGQGLAQAQKNLEGTKLRELSAQRNALVAALTREARQAAAAAGQPVGDQGTTEVDRTLRTVLADQHAADELATGRLAHALAPGGTLPDIPAAAAPPPVTPAPPVKAQTSADQAARKDRERQQRLTEAERAVRQLEAAAHVADADLARARASRDRAGEQLRSARERLGLAEQAVARARDAVAAAEQSEREAGGEAEAAEQRAKQAGQQLADQQAALAALHSGTT